MFKGPFASRVAAAAAGHTVRPLLDEEENKGGEMKNVNYPHHQCFAAATDVELFG